MTAKEYLIKQLEDPEPSATSVQTRTALCAYAFMMDNGNDGYSISEAESLIKSRGFNESFVKSCIDFLSFSREFLIIAKRVPPYIIE